MDDILQKIIELKKIELEQEKQILPLTELKAQLADLPPTLDFAGALCGEGINIIGELKRSSPSRGIIREDFSIGELATALVLGGAAALSVLTEKNFFGGSLDNLRLVRQLVKIPLLRKDFIFDEYQLYQARIAGADAVLLIAAMLNKSEFCRLLQAAEDLGLAVLAEAHTAAEVDCLQECDGRIIGINARNLHNFTTSLEEVAKLLPKIEKSRIAVAESAIGSAGDIDVLRRAGAQAFLVGEKLMRSAAPDVELRRLLE